MIKVTLWLLFLAFLCYLVFCLVLYFQQRSIIYYPTGQANSIEAQTIWLEHESQRLKIWHVEGSGDRALIYFGGNAEDVSINLVQFKSWFPDYSLYLLNYRGYGGSSGSPSEAALYSDSIALYELVRKRHDNISVLGRSLGTGVAVYLASEKEVSGLILVTPYSSMAELGAHYYPLIPVKTLIKDRFESSKRAAAIEVPTLCLVAEYDEVIPRAISDKLVRSFAPEHVQSIVITKTSHNSIDTNPEYGKKLRTFMDRL